MSFDRTSTWISRNRNAMLIYVCDRKSRGKNLNNQFLLFPFENEKFHMQNSVSSISCCRSWGELVENLGGASSTMCIQLIRNKLRRFHTQAASGSRLANFPSSITNFAQNLARMCQGLFYMHFLWVVWAPSIVPSIPMHGRLSKGQSQPLTPAPLATVCFVWWNAKVQEKSALKSRGCGNFVAPSIIHHCQQKFCPVLDGMWDVVGCGCPAAWQNQMPAIAFKLDLNIYGGNLSRVFFCAAKLR